MSTRAQGRQAELLQRADNPDTGDELPEGKVRAEPVAVGADESGLRLDRWFRRRYPAVAHGTLERLLRTGQVRVDGHRATAGERLEVGQRVRVPSSIQAAPAEARTVRIRADDRTDPGAAEELRRRVLHRDAHVIVIDKPAGLAVQGGSKMVRHLDGMLDALTFDGERPRLVHRLDKDTSGVLVLARSAKAAALLTRAFREGRVQKVYWAVVVGAPATAEGRISQPLAKRFGVSGERVGADDDGLPAVTGYRVIERAGRQAAWLALYPQTGRTHQLRAHCVLLGTPILGDGKYGGAAAFREGEDTAGQLHLHARAISFPHPAGGEVTVTAPISPHMRTTFRFFGFSEHLGNDMSGGGTTSGQSPRAAPSQRRPAPRPHPVRSRKG
ncbi:MAG: RluA family pseudouridine synthase [Rhodospirillales bacterium]|nr:RluA family pseudouridine synthase [Rhodospirillales bacterium]